MARRVIGYRDARPIYEDEGPGRGRLGASGGGDAIGRLGVAAMPDRESLEAGDRAPIERRQLTQEERAARAEEAIARVPSLLARPAAPVIRALPVTPSPLEEGSMVAPVITPPASNGHANIPIPIPASRAVDVVTPCGDCAHAPICRIRPLFEDLVVDARFADAQVDPAIRIVAVSIECEYFLERPQPAGLAAIPAIARRYQRELITQAREGVTPAVAPDDAQTPAPVAPRPSARERGGSGASTSMPAYVRRMVDAMVEAKGDRPAAARALGIKLESLVGSLSAVRARTDLTAVERAAVAVTRRSPGATA